MSTNLSPPPKFGPAPSSPAPHSISDWVAFFRWLVSLWSVAKDSINAQQSIVLNEYPRSPLGGEESLGAAQVFAAERVIPRGPTIDQILSQVKGIGGVLQPRPVEPRVPPLAGSPHPRPVTPQLPPLAATSHGAKAPVSDLTGLVQYLLSRPPYPGNASVNGVPGAVTITAGENTEVTTAGATITVDALSATKTTAANPYTALSTDVTIVTSAAGASVLDLPHASTVPGKLYIIRNENSGSGAVTVTPFAGDTVDGAATLVVANLQGVILQSDGVSNWIQVLASAAGSLSIPVTVPDGGTGVTTLANHGVVIGQGSSAVHVTGAGTAGQVLTSNGASADPTFQPAAAGGTTLVLSEVVKTANYIITTSDFGVYASLAGVATFTLPGASTCAGQIFAVKNETSSGAELTLAAAGGDTIEGFSAFGIDPGQSYMVQSLGGTKWIILYGTLATSAWTPFTTVVANVGAITNNDCAYLLMGKTAFFRISVQGTPVGGAGPTFSLPFLLADILQTAAGYVANGAVPLAGIITFPNTFTAEMNVDNGAAFPGGIPLVMTITGVVEVT